MVGNDAALFERIGAIAYPGLTADFDAGKIAALALGRLDWKDFDRAYAAATQATCGIGLPHAVVPALPGDVNGLRLGVPEIVRPGLGPAEMEELSALIARGLRSELDACAAATEVTTLRRRFRGLRFVRV